MSTTSESRQIAMKSVKTQHVVVKLGNDGFEMAKTFSEAAKGEDQARKPDPADRRKNDRNTKSHQTQRGSDGPWLITFTCERPLANQIYTAWTKGSVSTTDRR